MTQTVIQTPVLNPAMKYKGRLPTAKAFQVLRISATRPCRVQLYSTQQAQLSDIARSLDVPPAGGIMQGLITDVVLDTAPYTWQFQNRIGANMDAPQQSCVYATITNLGSASKTITVSLQYVPLEV